MKKHGEHPTWKTRTVKGGVLNTSDHHVTSNPAIYAAFISREVPCTEEEFAVAFKSAIADESKTRTAFQGKQRALKSDMLDGAAMWDIKNPSDLHRAFTELQQLKQKLKPPPRDTATVMGSLLELTDKLNQRDADRQSRDEQRELDFTAQVKAKAVASIPAIKAQYEKKKTQLDVREQYLDTRSTMLDERQAQIQKEEEDPGEIETLQKKNKKLDWEIRTLKQTVQGLEQKAQLAKNRQKGRAEEKRRNMMFNSHTATHTPESATKRTAKRTRN
jgi:predicted transcriptional regulator